MREMTLTVPEQYVDDFRAALAHELGTESGYVATERKEYLHAVSCHENAEKVSLKREDLDGALRLLEDDVRLFAQVGAESEGDVTVTVADPRGTLAFACETVAREIVAPRLADLLDCGPFDAAYAEKISEVQRELDWCIESAVATNEAASAARAEVA